MHFEGIDEGYVLHFQIFSHSKTGGQIPPLVFAMAWGRHTVDALRNVEVHELSEVASAWHQNDILVGS
jgi:hypothetical protein